MITLGGDSCSDMLSYLATLASDGCVDRYTGDLYASCGRASQFGKWVLYEWCSGGDKAIRYATREEADDAFIDADKQWCCDPESEIQTGGHLHTWWGAAS